MTAPTRFVVRFATALEAARRASMRVGRSGGVDLVPCDQVGVDELFALDTLLRRDTPGNAGLAGTREFFADELDSAECGAALQRRLVRLDGLEG